MRVVTSAVAVLLSFFVAGHVGDSVADTSGTTTAAASAALEEVCPTIVEFNPAQMFYKNNKPRRANSAINAPVVGFFKQMTLAYNAGRRGPLGKKMYDSEGGVLSSMRSYPCRSDHCGGRVVSSVQTDVARRAAVARTGSPKGYVGIGGNRCVEIPDIGRCYGNEVNKGRPLCNQLVG